MKLVIISDTHNKHGEMEIPEGDVLIHAGDSTNWGDMKHLTNFIEWFNGLDFDHKIMISGNHDTMFQNQQSDKLKKIIGNDAIYLEDDSVTIDGVNFYGSPWTPWYGDWAFTVRSIGERERIWKKIPDDTDVLITHGPPFGILDRSGFSMEHVGCAALLSRVKKIKPKVHVFGHIHFDYGEEEQDGIRFVNASMVGEDRLLSNEPIVLDI